MGVIPACALSHSASRISDRGYGLKAQTFKGGRPGPTLSRFRVLTQAVASMPLEGPERLRERDLSTGGVRGSLLSALLSVNPGRSRHQEERNPADRTIYQWFTGFLTDSADAQKRLISVRSKVQLLPGPFLSVCPARA